MDALPDITSPEIQINTSASALAPEEVEKQISVPLERAMTGLPGLEEMRSLSKFGFSQITLIVDAKRDLYQLRQLINERMQSILGQLPLGTQPILAQISSGLGEIFYYEVDYSKNAAQRATDRHQQLMDLKSVQDWVIAPMLKEVSGVAEVSTSGGFDKQIIIQPDPNKMRNFGISLDDLSSVVRQNTENAGGSVFQRAGQQVIVRSMGRVQTPDEILNLPIRFAAGTKPILVRDLASVEIGSSPRAGAALKNGEETVIGGVIMLRGENTRIVTQRLNEKLKSIQKKLPQGLEVHALYDRGELVNATIYTVEENLFLGAILVIVVLFAFLGNWRAALIVAFAIPLSLFFTLTGMVQTGLAGNLMSLGAIDFGLIVDGAVVMTDNIMRHLTLEQKRLGRSLLLSERLPMIIVACKEINRPMIFGISIITLVYLPILTLTGIEGKMFKPMASTVMMALVGALIVALALIPTLCAYGLTGRLKENQSPLLKTLEGFYGRLLSWALDHYRFLIGISGVLVLIAFFIFMRLGAEFVPSLDEGSYLAVFQRTPSIGLDASLAIQSKTEKVLLREFPEIKQTFSRVGTDDKAVDPVGLDRADTYLGFTPPSTWRKIKGRRVDKNQLADLMSRKLSETVPGETAAFSQPIEDRFNDFLEGARADVSIKVFGENFDILENLGHQIQTVLQKIHGAADITLESFGKTPVLEITPNRQNLNKYDLQAADIGRVISVGMGGLKLGEVIEGDRPVDIILRFPETIRENIDELENVPIRLGDGGFIPLNQIADLTFGDKVNEIRRDSGRRRISVLVNLRNRDLEGFVRDAQQQIQAQIKLPSGYSIEFGGQFKNLQSAQSRLKIVIPVALGLICFLIYSAFGSWRQTLLICTGIPLAVTGGIFSLALRGLPFSISAAVGFIALSGVAVLNGIVLISFFNQLRSEVKSLRDAVIGGSLTRLRPVLMTALVASFGFVPMAFAHGVGAEVQRPLATVVIGGILTSTFLTLILLPALYFRFEKRENKTFRE